MKNKVFTSGLLFLFISSTAIAEICSDEQLEITLDNQKNICLKNNLSIEKSKIYKKFESDFLKELEDNYNELVTSTIYYYPKTNEILVVAHRDNYYKY